MADLFSPLDGHRMAYPLHHAEKVLEKKAKLNKEETIQ